jgi:TonB-dependent SusC/RagA subfamily outer membrane receptor
MRKKLLLARSAVLCLLVLLNLPAFSQNKIITGQITDSSGAPIAGVSVVAAGSASGTTTNAAGAFRLSVSPEAKTLVVSSIGYATQRIAITGAEIRVNLAATSNIQNEVIVIGYGGVQKKDLTGAVSTVSTKDFQKGAITSPDQLIAGKLAGVTVTANGGSPGAGSTIRIRGLSSLNSNNAPLIVLDGVPLPSTVNSNGTSDGTSTISGVSNPLSLINPDDIESITVLKDASSAAIYGSRASAGVLIVITKKGHAGDATYNFNTSNTVGTVAKDSSAISLMDR